MIQMRGNVSITTSDLIIDAATTNMETGIVSRTLPGSNGKAGKIEITVLNNAQIMGIPELWNGGISSANLGNNHAGEINLSVKGYLYLTGGMIETLAKFGNGGRIDINSPLLIIANGRIITSVSVMKDYQLPLQIV